MAEQSRQRICSGRQRPQRGRRIAWSNFSGRLHCGSSWGLLGAVLFVRPAGFAAFPKGHPSWTSIRSLDLLEVAAIALTYSATSLDPHWGTSNYAKSNAFRLTWFLSLPP